MSRSANRNLGVFAVLLLSAATLVLLAGPGVSLYYELMQWVVAQQRAFHQSMTASLSDLADSASYSTAYAVIAGSFLYGIFHAAGPGHGKVVLSTYLLAKPEAVPKSLMMAIAASALQGVVAIGLVYGLFYLFGVMPRSSRVAALWTERLSYLLVLAIGLWLMWRAIKLVRSVLAEPKSSHGTHSHHHEETPSHHGHIHHHAEGEACSHCGHAHLPNADQTAAAVDFRSTLGVIFSIGLRPCSGALLVLVFAKFAGIPWAGVLAVIAMSAGTAITVAGLALIAVKGRALSQQLLSLSDNGAVWFGAAVTAGAGAVLILMGAGLFTGSFETTTRSMGLG